MGVLPRWRSPLLPFLPTNREIPFPPFFFFYLPRYLALYQDFQADSSTFNPSQSKRFGYIPVRTVWGAVFAAIVLGLLCLIASAAASALFSLAVAGNNVAWGVPVFCRATWGRSKFEPGPFYTGRFSLPIAWFTITFLVYSTLLAMFPDGGPDPTAQTMNYTIVINMAVWGGCTLYYFVEARKWFTGPKTTVEEVEQITGHVVQGDKREGLVDETKTETEGSGGEPESKPAV